MGARAVLLALMTAAAPAPGPAGAVPPADPLAGVVLGDLSGRTWRLDELHDSPVLVVVADRKAAAQARAWGARLAAMEAPLAPWRAPGKVAWVSVADLRRVPDYARGSARERLREREEARGEGERRLASPLLLDWEGTLAARLEAAQGEARLVLLAPDRRVLVALAGAPSDDAVARLRDALAALVAG